VTENWFALFERTAERVSMNINTGTFCGSQDVQMLVVPSVYQHLGCHRSNCVFNSHLNFNTSNFHTEHLVLHIIPEEKVQRFYIRVARSQEMGLFCSIHWFGKV
jgi:hypothetical protein